MGCTRRFWGRFVLHDCRAHQLLRATEGSSVGAQSCDQHRTCLGALGNGMILARRIRLVPTLEQELHFRRACGVARFAYNGALAEWKRQYDGGTKPSEVALRKALNAIKYDRFPWMRGVTKNAPQQAIKNLGRAYANFFDNLKKHRCGQLQCKRGCRHSRRKASTTVFEPTTARTGSIPMPSGCAASASSCRSSAESSCAKRSVSLGACGR